MTNRHLAAAIRLQFFVSHRPMPLPEYLCRGVAPQTVRAIRQGESNKTTNDLEMEYNNKEKP